MINPNRKPVVSAIVAIGNNRQMGRDGDLLWHIPDDMRRLKEITNGHPIIMGRKTWESIPEKRRPLPDRANIVITRDENYEATGAVVVHSLEDAISRASKIDYDPSKAETGEIFIFGGAEIYKQALPFTDKLYLTIIDSDKHGDTFFPEYEDEFSKETFRHTGEHNGLKYTWLNLER